MNGPILVTYATRSGSTAGVAEAIAQVLVEGGTPAEARPMSTIPSLQTYRAVIAGSPIQGQKWLPEALRFLQAHQTELRRKPFAAFMVCITLSMKDSDRYRPGLSAWMEPVRSIARPVREGMFAGALDFRKMPLTANTLFMRVPVLLGIWKTGDHRDWNAIRAWAKATYPLLLRPQQ